MTRPSSPFVNLSAISQRENGSNTPGPRPRPLPGGPRNLKPSKLSMSNVFDEDEIAAPRHDHIPRKLSEPLLTNIRQAPQDVYGETFGECSTTVHRSATFHPGRPRGSSHASALLSQTFTAASPPMQHMVDNTTAHQIPQHRLSRSNTILPRYSSLNLNIASPTPLRLQSGPISPTLDSPDVLSYYGLEGDPYLFSTEMQAPEYIRPLPPMPTQQSTEQTDIHNDRSSYPFSNLTQTAATVVEPTVPQLPDSNQPQQFASEKDLLQKSSEEVLSSQQQQPPPPTSSTSSLPLPLKLSQPQSLESSTSSRSSPELSKSENMVRPLNKPILSISQPPFVKFDSVPIAWRGLTLDAAQWSLSSEDLQAIVSRAIRRSSEESSIRLVPLDTLDNEIAREKERLEYMKSATQTKYRFLVQRRTMLLQSLAATVNNGTFDAEAMAELVLSLSDLAIQGDKLVGELYQYSDQYAQLMHLIDNHASSALSVALRKLNTSYTKRGDEISKLTKRLESTDMEREEAWRVAEEIAKELDEKKVLDDGENDDNDDYEGDGDGGDDDDANDSDDDGDTDGGDMSEYDVEVRNITGHAFASSAKLERTSNIVLKVPGTGPRTRTRKRSDSVSSRVSAARTRSQRASKASLRIPRGVMQKGILPPSPLQILPKHPPLPQIRVLTKEKSVPSRPPLPTSSGSSFLDLVDRPTSSIVQDVEQQIKKLMERTEEAAPLEDDEHLRPVSISPKPLTMVLPLRLDTKFQRRDGNNRVQSMLSPDASNSQSPPSMTLSIITTSVDHLSEKDSSSRKNRPSSMPISAITAEDKPYDYF